MRTMVAFPVSPSVFPRLLVIATIMMAALLSPAAVAAKPLRLGAGDWRAIQAVIGKQLDAFRLNDGNAAFSLASPGVRQVFESADNFMEMVRTEYGAVCRPRAYRFLKPAILDGEPVQPVELIALDGALSIAVFSMEHQPNRSWRISGCHLLASRQFAT
jgi:Domain of unknown function (DUF4864)